MSSAFSKYVLRNAQKFSGSAPCKKFGKDKSFAGNSILYACKKYCPRTGAGRFCPPYFSSPKSGCPCDAPWILI